MYGIIRAELLKMRHTFSKKLVIGAPLTTLLLGYLLSGSYVQLSAYNWWYFMILPLVVSLCSAGMIVREQKTAMQNIACLPVPLDKLWLGKTAALAILLLVSNILMWGSATAVGLATRLTVAPLDGLIGCMLLFLTCLWQLPFIMLLVYLMDYIPAILVSMTANMLLPAAFSETRWFLFVPYAIPARIVCPFFKMHVSGLPLESGSPLLSAGYVPPSLIISLALALVIFWCSSKLFSKGGLLHD